MSQFAGEGELDINWAVHKEWPEGLMEEERLLLDYFKKLKFIYLEQETKMRFMADIQDDLESGKEATVYSATEVAERERVAKTLKTQLTEAKAEVRGLRKEVDAAADELFEPWQEVDQDSREAEVLIKEIGDMELELAKIRAQSHGKGGNVAAIAGRDGPLTTTEAEEYLDGQVEEMTALEGKTADVKKAIEATKKDLVSSLRALDRINAERSLAEKFASEAKLGMGVDGGRDLETERLCASHAATISLLRSLLGIDEIEAISPTEIRITYKLPLDSILQQSQQEAAGKAAGSRRKRKSIALPDQSLVHVNLRFKDVGGRIDEVSVTSSKGEQYDMPEASMARLRALQKANDVPLIVQEVLAAF
uniref:Kinetochore protein Sos7 coiled-coil domain-containing protein n=2 Tax=Kalmanozyma brasiliensis (strain GHG001) TaxID=1365824 RepID=V5GNF7_KALBG